MREIILLSMRPPKTVVSPRASNRSCQRVGSLGKPAEPRASRNGLPAMCFSAYIDP
ncbi:MAG: hypothetical protein K8U57_14680 [Planctomycetes bacterium]|nr:hypothetical protein [Planctomycetota bacterium]